MTFAEKLQLQWKTDKFVCVGLDPDENKIPVVRSLGFGTSGFNGDTVIFAFNRAIIDATKELVCAYKLNSAFYEKHGSFGITQLEETISYIRKVAPDVLVILDAKRADIGNTNNGYVEFAFDYLSVDAVTVHPYLGMEAMKPFLDRVDRGVIVLCRTSNPGAGEFQDLAVTVPFVQKPDSLEHEPDPEFVAALGKRRLRIPLYEYVAYRVAHQWNYNGNCAVVVGATYPAELTQVRAIVGELPVLIPGVGAQGGDLEAAVTNGQNSTGNGFLINSSRGIIFASSGEDFAEAARAETIKLHDQISAALGREG